MARHRADVPIDAKAPPPAETTDSAALGEVECDLHVVEGSEAYARGDFAATIKAPTAAAETNAIGFDAWLASIVASSTGHRRVSASSGRLTRRLESESARLRRAEQCRVGTGDVSQ